MDDKLKDLNKLYNSIKIPEHLDRVVNDAIYKEKKDGMTIMRAFNNKLFKRIGVIAASCVIILGATVNASPIFAEEIYKIPVVGHLAKMITFREYSNENETSISKVKIPNVMMTDHKMVEALMNKTIKEKVDQILEEQAVLDAEYKQAYLETGGKEEDYNKIEITVDYKKHYVSENMISFEISKYQTLAPAYDEKYFYTINLKTGKSLTLKDALGENYVSLIKDRVTEQMQSRMNKNNNDKMYNIDDFRNMEINENQNYYTQENGDIVVVFAKYEVACGSMGQQEFIAGSIKN